MFQLQHNYAVKRETKQEIDKHTKIKLPYEKI
jgi:hypothetical protein